MLPIVLGSSSSSRRSVLTAHGVNFSTMEADLDEKFIGESYRTEGNAKNLVIHLSTEKSKALRMKCKENCILITCDQVVVCNGVIREKPENEEESRRFINSYATNPAETFAGVCVYNTLTKKCVADVDVAKQYFKPIPEYVVDAIIAEGSVFKSAGGFMIDHRILLNLL
jgi:septum formation protein